MTPEDLFALYEEEVETHGDEAYKNISRVFEKARKKHAEEYKGEDAGQSWRAIKGRGFEKLVIYIIEKSIKKLGLEILKGDRLERRKEVAIISERSTLDEIRDNLMISYVNNKQQMPDADLIVYNPEDNQIIAILSCKITLRERIAQTGYWKLKLASQEETENIKVLFVTLDEDRTLIDDKHSDSKPRVIAENDIDTCYVICEEDFTETPNIKKFDKLIGDLKALK